MYFRFCLWKRGFPDNLRYRSNSVPSPPLGFSYEIFVRCKLNLLPQPFHVYAKFDCYTWFENSFHRFAIWCTIYLFISWFLFTPIVFRRIPINRTCPAAFFVFFLIIAWTHVCNTMCKALLIHMKRPAADRTWKGIISKAFDIVLHNRSMTASGVPW